MTADPKPWYRRLSLLLTILLLAVLFLPGASIYYNYSGGRSCARCHEIWQPYRDWRSSTHRNVPCSDCHGNEFTLDAGFHLKNIERLFAHLGGEIPEHVLLKADEVEKMGARCRKCHELEYTDWATGPHAATYKEVFLDAAHNSKEPLNDDCLRCHAMHFNGGIKDLIAPTDTKGPWRLRDPKLADRLVIPCLACHQMHRQGNLSIRPAVKPLNPGPEQMSFRPSLAFFDRRQLDYVGLGRLPLPAMKKAGRAVKISPDIRQALCYQCHAPRAEMQVDSGDDRTTVGVHEGLSCLACHQGHGEKTRASCATCHPQLSNCGVDVETMDTTFKSTKSPHNIHFVECIDCHRAGVPKKKPPRA